MTDFSAKLVAEDGSSILLVGEQQVGRGTDSDIIIDDGRISRKHAVIRVQDEVVSAEDLGSSNGTRLNGMPITGPVTLSDGDTIKFDQHSYVVAIQGASETEDATIVGQVDSDATVVSSVTEPAAVAAETPDPAQAASLDSVDLPGSWINSGTGESTRVLSISEFDGGASKAGTTQRASELAHLIVLDASGTQGGVVELQTSDSQDVWEIGREAPCEIVLNESSVSERHAQLIHEGGRWRVVNLVSTNGIFVNGEKVLTGYLSDGDEIRLGVLTLVFHASAAQVSESRRQDASGHANTQTAPPHTGRNLPVAAVASLVFLLAVLFLGWWLF